MIDEVMEYNDQESHIVACCLAVAIEDLEKYIYDGEWTPSVSPYKDDRKFEIPFKSGEEDSDGFAGPPWNRHRVSVFDKYPTLSKLRKTGIKTLPKKGLGGRGIDQLSEREKKAFREGKRSDFIKSVRIETGCTLRQSRE